MHELTPAPRKSVEPKGNLVFYRQHEKVSIRYIKPELGRLAEEKGGHFAAREQQTQFVDDMEPFVEIVLGEYKLKNIV